MCADTRGGTSQAGLVDQETTHESRQHVCKAFFCPVILLGDSYLEQMSAMVCLILSKDRDR